MSDIGFFNPQDMVSHAGIREGMKIADFGSGSGEMAIMMARIVGKDGRVTALDVLKSALESVQAKAKSENLENVDAIRANLEAVNGSKLADASQDVVFLANILWQSQKKEEILKEAHRVLKTDGVLAAVEWTPSSDGAKKLGPPHEARISSEAFQELLHKAGLHFTGTFAAGAYHYGLLAKKS